MPLPPSKTWRAVFCPIFKPCIPLFYRRAHKCGKKGRKWGSNINLYYLISAEQPATLYWGLFTAIVTIVTGLLWLLQGNTNQLNRKLIWSYFVSFDALLYDDCVCVCLFVGGFVFLCLRVDSAFNYGLIKQGWQEGLKRPLPEATLPKSLMHHRSEHLSA